MKFESSIGIAVLRRYCFTSTYKMGYCNIPFHTFAYTPGHASVRQDFRVARHLACWNTRMTYTRSLYSVYVPQVNILYLRLPRFYSTHPLALLPDALTLPLFSPSLLSHSFTFLILLTHSYFSLIQLHSFLTSA